VIPIILKKVLNVKFIFILVKDDNKLWFEVLNKIRRLLEKIYKCFPGMPREKLSKYLNLADCIVIPSLSEGFGLTTLESCTIGKCVVATDVGFILEVVFGKYVLVKPGSAEAIAEGCLKAFSGEIEQSEPKNFKWEDTIKKCKEIYKKVLTE